MLFSTPAYIFLFLPVVVLIYFVLNKIRLVTTGKIWLILASFFFYGYSVPAYLPLLIFSILVNFFLGSRLNHSSHGNLYFHQHLSNKTILTIGVIFNLGLLGYFKYANFFIKNINLLADSGYSPLKWTLPLAISFYTFQQISYLADSYFRERQKSNFLDYCFFVVFFPQLIAGPIVRYQEMMPQYLDKFAKSINWQNMATGIFIFAIGLFKKVIIADTFALWANAGFVQGKAPGFIEAWGAILSYTFQLYYDFSGYSDMAIGAALFFNIRLPVNFNSPYKATNIQDFWRRWHITLSRWLGDYLYIPLGGNRKGTIQTLFNLFITFLLGGLWHGAGWTFVVWGVMHGIALGIHRTWRQCGLRMPAIIGWFCTFIFINVTWVFFRAPTLAEAFHLLKGMAGVNLITIQQIRGLLPFLNITALLHMPMDVTNLFLSNHTHIWGIGFALLVFCTPSSMQIINFVPYHGVFVFKTDIKRAVFLAILLFLSFTEFMGNVAPAEFIYFNF